MVNKNRELTPTEAGGWKPYVKEKTKKYYWRDKIIDVLGEFPKICPLAIPDDRYPPEYNSLKDLDDEVNTAKKCKLFSTEMDCECWFESNPGRCDCWRVYWGCTMFRTWLKMKEQKEIEKEHENPT